VIAAYWAAKANRTFPGVPDATLYPEPMKTMPPAMVGPMEPVPGASDRVLPFLDYFRAADQPGAIGEAPLLPVGRYTARVRRMLVIILYRRQKPSTDACLPMLREAVAPRN